MTNSDEIKEEAKAYAEKTIKELKEALKYARKSSRKQKIKRDITFWGTQVIENREGALDKFFERYPRWEPK